MLKGIEELIANRYGSKKGMLSYWRYQPLWRSFSWAVRPDNPGDIRRLVFVCHGNICRSAMASAVADHLGFPNVSYGLDTRDGKPAEPRMINAARQLGYHLENHQATRIEHYRVLPGDLVCLMEPSHLPSFYATHAHALPTTLLGLWHPRPSAYIHDPLCCNEAYFAHCARFVEESVEQLTMATTPRAQPDHVDSENAASPRYHQ